MENQCIENQSRKSKDVQIVYKGQKEYPCALNQLASPPQALYVRGPMWWREECQFLSIVGSRRIDPASTTWLERVLPSLLARGPLIPVSGGAPGVDSHVHRMSLLYGRGTIVFLPCGFGFESYWQRWEKYKGVTLVTAYPPKTPIQRFHFHQRNQLIAALSPASLIVQSGLKSGSIMTANMACDLGRAVGVVPGHPNHASFLGNLKLLRDGAMLVSDSCDINNLMHHV